MDQQKQAIADRLKQSNNILVTVSSNPSVDQLASCIGLTLALNKMGKHATAVFSGNVPSTIEFLQPEKTLEKNTDSLRDFIIALDKAKADKLRYKVEDKVVKIFITPYKTSITEKDLDFSQGDFNVDVVLALGVHEQTELDQAITAHGRILHDAVVATINTKPGGELGTVNWLETTASSLSELVVQLVDTVDKSMMDGQMATAFLTGIVAETNRFSNEKTTPNTMSISAELMAAGANQQLVATKLEEPAAPPPPPPTPAPTYNQEGERKGDDHQENQNQAGEDGTLEIAHVASEEPVAPPLPQPPAPEPERERAPDEQPTQQIHIDDQGALRNIEHPGIHNEPMLGGPTIDPTQHMASSHMILEPPAIGGQMTANTEPEDVGSGDPLSLPQPNEPLFGTPNEFGSPTASATITAPNMPYMPPSMMPSAAPAFPPVPTPTPPAFSPPPSAVPAPEPPAQQFVQPQSPVPSPALAFEPPAQPDPQVPVPQPFTQPEPTTPPSETLSQIEADVNSPHLQPVAAQAETMQAVPPPPTVAPTIMPPVYEPAVPAAPALPPAPAPTAPPPAQGPETGSDLENARDAVMQAIAGQAQSTVAPEPIQALNAQPLGDPLHDAPAPAPVAPINYDAASNPTFTLPDVQEPSTNPAPPASPPPMMPPANFGQ
jgi:hypothetical protein